MRPTLLDYCFHLPILSIQIFVFYAFFFIQGAIAAPTPLSQVEFDRLEESTVYLKRPAGSTLPPSFKTDLFDVSYVGTLHPSDGTLPYIFLSGKHCQNCSEDRGIFAVRPLQNKPTSFIYPGKIFDYQKRNLVFESRAFLGKCVPHKGDVFIVFQSEQVDRHGMQPSVFIAEAAKYFLDETLFEGHFSSKRKRNWVSVKGPVPSISTTLALVKKKSCIEIEGRNRFTPKVTAQP